MLDRSRAMAWKKSVPGKMKCSPGVLQARFSCQRLVAPAAMKNTPVRANPQNCGAAALGCVLTLLAAPAWATEGGVGRPITGMQITPYAGIVPPEPGLTVSFSSIYYDASRSRDQAIPIGGRLEGGLDMQVSYNLLNAVYVWDTGTTAWNFASGIGLPYQFTDVSAYLNDLKRTDSSSNFADLLLIPIVASHHFSPTSHMALSLQVYAPTGSYDSSRLANAGQNVWTYIPTLAYTKLWPKQNVEFSASWGVQFYSRNSDTDYKSGALNTLDVMAVKRFANGFGIGLVGGWIQQLESDSGALADRLDGNRGYSLGLGPTLTWNHAIDKERSISASLRWVNEIDASKRPKGNAYLLNVAATF